MKSIYILVICAIILLPSCKKDTAVLTDLEISGFGPAVFTGGDAISIYGSGFDPDPEKNTVSFNGVSGEVATASPNRLQVIVPVLATSGHLIISTHGKTITSQAPYSIVNLLQGTYTDNFILTSDRQYLLRGDVIFNSKLIIQPGTVIYGEKQTKGSLTAYDVDFEGTVDHPIVFTSDQPAGQRNPGDWKGVNILAQRQDAGSAVPNGILQYIRVEYAGYFETTYNHNPFSFTGPYWGAAFTIIPTAGSTYKYLQVSYSSSDAFCLTSMNYNANTSILGGETFFSHLVAFGCMGADFRIQTAGIRAQFGLGLKDPYFASAQKSDGIVAINTGANTNLFSNFTLVGSNPDARNILQSGLSVSNDAACCLKIGENYYPDGTGMYSVNNISVSNSVIIGGSRAAVEIGGSNDANWGNYELSGGLTIQLRNNFITGSRPMDLPSYGGVFAHADWRSISDVFLDISQDSKLKIFGQYNDTTRQLSFARAKDDLGVGSLVDYHRLNNPGVLPAPGSVLLHSAQFTAGTLADNPFLDKNTVWCGAFGTEDWTKGWSNFSPQTTHYNN